MIARPGTLLLVAAVAFMTVAAPALAGHDVLQPGDPTPNCTLSWVLEGASPPAGHPTAQGADGDAVYFTIAGHCLDKGDRVRSPGFGSFGTVAYDNDTLDLALIHVDDAVEPSVVPQVKGHEEAPTGFTTSRDYETGETILHSGYGTGPHATAETRENRAGVLVEDNDDAWGWKAVTPVSFGDSGGPVIYGANGSALGIVNVLPDPAEVEPGNGAGLAMDQIFANLRGAGFDVDLRTVDCASCYGDDPVPWTEAVSAGEDARTASVYGDAHGGTVAASVQGDARGPAAASGTGNASGVIAGSGAGDADGFAAGASAAGDATGAAAVAPLGNASGIVGATVTGDAAGLVAASAGGDADGAAVASGTGNASGALAVTGTGNASGLVPLSVTGSCSGSSGPREDCANVTRGEARGHHAAASLHGDADCTSDLVCGSVSGTGNASGPAAVAGTGNASGLVAASGTGNATGVVAVSGTGEADGFLLEVSGCETASDQGLPVACTSPSVRALP